MPLIAGAPAQAGQPTLPGSTAPTRVMPGPPAPELPLMPSLLPARSDAPALPVLQPRPVPMRPQGMESITYLRRVEKILDVTQVEETVRRKVEERLEKKVTERVEHVVARELSPDSSHARRLRERIYNGLYESLVLEKERLG
jgi:hypothetical protein